MTAAAAHGAVFSTAVMTLARRLRRRGLRGSRFGVCDFPLRTARAPISARISAPINAPINAPIGAPLRALAASLLASLVLGACAPLPTRPSSGLITDIPEDVAPVSPTRLSPAYGSEDGRIETADRVWQLLADRFYDPHMNGADWAGVRVAALARAAAARSDAAFYAVLKAMTAQLHDSHTQVLTPREALDRRRFITTRLGVTLHLIDGQVAVLEGDPESRAAADMRPGDVVLGIDGVTLDADFIRAASNDPATAWPASLDAIEALPADPRDAESVRVMRAVIRVLAQALEREPQSARTVRLDLQLGDGSTRAVVLRPTAQARPPQAKVRWLDGQTVVIRFNRFVTELRSDLERALEAAAGAQAIIIDLRGNGGGDHDLYLWFVGRFLPDERAAMRTVTRGEGAPALQKVRDVRAGPGSRAPLLQPIAVLIDARTDSAAELAAVTLQEQRGAALIGEPTCGCVVGVPVEYVLPDGGGVRIAETGFISMRGARMEGEPTLPAVRVVPTLADLRAGRDVVLEEALRRFNARAPR